MMDYYGDFGVTGAPQAAVSPEVQAYIDRLKAYEQQQTAAGRLVRPSTSMGTDYASLMAQNVNPESYYQTGYQFLTNAGKKAKAKANPSAQIFYDPNKTYVFENERKNNKGTDYRTFESEVLDTLRLKGRVDLLMDLRDMLSYTLDVA